MLIAINEASAVPIYLQIHHQIVQGISDGSLSPGEQLPTVRTLADEIGINSMTVSKAYQLLKQEGYLSGDRRNGARVREDLSHVARLSDKNRELLKQIVSEAKVGGMTRGEFLELCDLYYRDASSRKGTESLVCSPQN